jgi:cobalt-zinc-cadmium efflux system protein
LSAGCRHHIKLAESHKSEQRLFISFFLNTLLAIAQFLCGLLAGSLALVADALHNANDAITLLLAWWAKRYGRLAPDPNHSYGHARIETIAAFANLISLGLFAIFIIEDAIQRLFVPNHAINGEIVVILSIIAVVINLATTLMLYSSSKSSLNVRAAFYHNLTDTLSSLAVLVSGVMIIMYQWYWLDTALSLLIALLMVYGMLREIKRVVNILMDAAPENLSPSDVRDDILKVVGVERIVDFHIRRLNEDINGVEAHIIIDPDVMPINVKKAVKMMLYNKFSVHHVTLETSTRDEYILLKTVPHQHTLLEEDGTIPS